MAGVVPVMTSPRVLLRTIHRVASGIRRPRALAEAMDVDITVVEASLRAGEWLGLNRYDADAVLTVAGMRCAAPGRSRVDALADVLRSHPFLGPHIVSGVVMNLEELARAVRIEAPTTTVPQARFIARRLRNFVEPCLRERRRPASVRQVPLSFASSPVEPPPALDLRAGPNENPDVYTLVLRALLDHGELSPTQLRALLDHNGGGACELGGYLAMAERRGDATRLDGTFVVTAGALARASLADSPVTVALSDPGFRTWVETALRDGSPPTPRFRAWSRRLFGTNPLATGLDRLLFGRSLASIPVAGDPGEPLQTARGAFLDLATGRGLVVAFPSSLTKLDGGLAAINRALRDTLFNPASARMPSPMDRRIVVHGGLLHPGEPPVRSIPDGVSLRLRALRTVPAFALLVALLVLERRAVLRVRQRGGDVWLLARGRADRRLGAFIETFARSRGWTLVVGPASVNWSAVVTVGEQICLVTTVEERITLDELLFHRLQTDAEHREVWDLLLPLTELLRDRVGAPFDP